MTAGAGSGGSGNIGSPGSPVAVSDRGSGALQLKMFATATANTTTGNGNVYLTDSDSDGSPSTPAVALGASAAKGRSGDSTGGNFSLATTIGSIGVGGAVTATTGITLVAQTNILQQTGGSLSSPKSL